MIFFILLAIMHPAPRLRRFAALIYDAFLLIAILALATFIILWLRDGETFGPNHVGFILYLLFWAGLYLVWCWSHGGQTLGMLAWRLRLVTDEGKPLSPSRACLRYLASVLGAWGFGIGILWCLIDRNKQSFADIFTGCMMVSSQPKKTVATP